MGCFLIYTDEDLDRTEVFNSLDEAYDRLAEESKGFIEALADVHHPNHQLAMSAALRGVSDDLPSSYRDAFIESVKNICRVEPTIVGLVHNYSYRAPQRIDGRNQGQTTILNTKINASRAAEVISAEAIRCRESSAGNTKDDVGALFFNPLTDRLDFQQKFQSRHLERERGSIEGDFKICRTVRDGIFTDHLTLGVDVKHSQSGTYGKMPGFDSQLNGVIRAIEAGELNEFHFVTKNAFSAPFKEAVEEANAKYWERHANDGAQISDVKGMGKTEFEEYQRAQRECVAKTPKIFWHEGVWLNEP